MNNKTLPSLLACTALLGAASAASAADFSAVIDTAALAGSTGYLVFDLLGGSAGTGNEVVVSAFSTTGTLGAGSGFGATTGSLVPGPLRLNSATGFFNEWLQGLTFGSELRFDFSSTRNVASPFPDNFSVYLLNAAQAPYASSDPTGANAVFTFTIDSDSSPQVYTSSFFTATVVPEPAAAWLLLAGLAVMAARRRAAAG